MARIAVCEPESGLAGNIETLIEKACGLITEKLETEVYLSGGDFLEGLAQGEAFQIVYMDLDMPDMDGFELGRRLREKFSARETLLIYISDAVSFGSGIFDVHPFSILQTPFGDKEFMRKLFLAVEHLQQADELFICRQGRLTHQLRKRDIICLESVGRDIILSADGRDDIQYREALKNERDKLCTINFLRPHNSFIVNLDYVDEYRSDSLLLRGNRLVPISELRMKETKQAILKFWEYRNI